MIIKYLNCKLDTLNTLYIYIYKVCIWSIIYLYKEEYIQILEITNKDHCSTIKVVLIKKKLK